MLLNSTLGCLVWALNFFSWSICKNAILKVNEDGSNFNNYIFKKVILTPFLVWYLYKAFLQTKHVNQQSFLPPQWPILWNCEKFMIFRAQCHFFPNWWKNTLQNTVWAQPKPLFDAKTLISWLGDENYEKSNVLC